MSPTAITYRIYETFFLFDCTQFSHFFKITKLNIEVCRCENSRDTDMSDGVKCKKFHALNMGPEWRGIFFIKTGGALAG
jgi:hypothetical protein